MPEDPQTAEMRTVQAEREAREREQAQHSEEPEAEAAHERRADKAGYLREKLEERARSEREG